MITSNSAAIPGPITGLTATETTTSGTISLVWGKPTLNSSALQSYEIQKSVNSGAWETIPGLSPSTTAEIVQLSVSGLAVEAGRTIQFRVRAKNAAGNGPWDTSAQISFIAGYSVSKSAVSVSESGSTETFTVRLNAKPASNVVISVVSDDVGEATVSASLLTFDTSNWATAQTVTVTGVADNSVDGNQNATLTLSVVDVSSDNNFDSLADQTVTATVADID
ncbi:MAG: fibronectin type III domain-containing protein [Actinomycetota bacterium]|nr:fibronectin type III domain-containing protein [Actinomycetota bacterium]